MEFSTFLKFGLYPNKELTRGGYDKIRYGIQLPLFSVCNKKKKCFDCINKVLKSCQGQFLFYFHNILLVIEKHSSIWNSLMVPYWLFDVNFECLCKL